MKEKSCMDFVNVLGSKAPVPGGGSASALVGAIGIALGNMVGALTVGKKKYIQVEEDMNRLIRSSEKLQEELLECIDKDVEAFAPLAKAYSMPNETEEQKKEKQETMEKALKVASEVPLEIVEKCCMAIELHREYAEKGSRLAVSDAGVGVILCKAAMQGASLNVYINTKMMKNRDYAERINREMDEKISKYSVIADEVFNKVKEELK